MALLRDGVIAIARLPHGCGAAAVCRYGHCRLHRRLAQEGWLCWRLFAAVLQHL